MNKRIKNLGVVSACCHLHYRQIAFCMQTFYFFILLDIATFSLETLTLASTNYRRVIDSSFPNSLRSIFGTYLRCTYVGLKNTLFWRKTTKSVFCSARRLPEDCLPTAWWMPDECLSNAWWMPDKCLWHLGWIILENRVYD